MKNIISLICLLSLSLISYSQTTVSGRVLSQDGFYAEYQNFYETQIFILACRYKF